MKASLIVGLCSLTIAVSGQENSDYVNFFMPNIQPKTEDSYLCHGMKMNTTETYITGFIPNIDMSVAHHMELFGCTTPGSFEPVWDCKAGSRNPDFPKASYCGKGGTIRFIYVWGRNAPSLVLPKDVAFVVGGSTDIQYLVVEIHYGDVTPFLPPNNGRDSSGVTLITHRTSLPRHAGIFLLESLGSLKPRSTVYMEVALKFVDKTEIHPFAYRVHTHALGKVVSGYRVRNGLWTEIGRMDPQKPQMFYNTTTPDLVVKEGDIFAVRCTMVNNHTYTVRYGLDYKNEMCMFYIMYFVDDGSLMKQSVFYTPGPPFWSWKKYLGHDLELGNIPETASTVPGTSWLQEQSRYDASRDFLEQLGIISFRKIN